MGFDLLVRGGLLSDGSGQPGRPADIGIEGDRVAAVGDLSVVSENEVATVIDATGLVVAPGFIDPHGHSDASALLDGALASHLRQGYTTQLSGNCGYTLAPLTPAARALMQPDLDSMGLEAPWTLLLRAESVASSRIEGLELSQQNLARALFGPEAVRGAPRSRRQRPGNGGGHPDRLRGLRIPLVRSHRHPPDAAIRCGDGIAGKIREE